MSTPHTRVPALAATAAAWLDAEDAAEVLGLTASDASSVRSIAKQDDWTTKCDGGDTLYLLADVRLTSRRRSAARQGHTKPSAPKAATGRAEGREHA
jgi:hypothetical protein